MTHEIKLNKGKLKSAENIRIGYFKQIRSELSPNETPYSYLGNGTDSVNLPSGRKMHVAGYIKRFLFTGEDLYRPLKTFSGGERNRIQLAKNLLTPADIWVFDEPTNDLDLETINVLEEELQRFEGSIIIVSHDRAFLSNITNKIWIIDKKNIEVFSGGYSQSEDYLEVIELERQIEKENLKKTKLQNQEIEKTQIKKEKPSNRDKIRIKELPKLIASSENEITKIDEFIASFDFANSSPERARAFSELSANKENIENELLSMYEELETLQEKFN